MGFDLIFASLLLAFSFIVPLTAQEVKQVANG